MTRVRSFGRFVRHSYVVRGFVYSAIAAAICYLIISMIVSSIQAHNRSVEHEAFCLNHGYSWYKEVRSFDNYEFWCMDIVSRPVDPKTLGWKKDAE